MHQDEGLTPLDEERARSMADEGGVSAARVESQEEPPPRRKPRIRRRLGPLPLVMLALVPH